MQNDTLLTRISIRETSDCVIIRERRSKFRLRNHNPKGESS